MSESIVLHFTLRGIRYVCECVHVRMYSWRSKAYPYHFSIIDWCGLNGQATREDSSLALHTSSARLVSASPTPYSHDYPVLLIITFLPHWFPLVSLVNWWANLTSISPINGSHHLPWVVKTVAMFCLPSGVHGRVEECYLNWKFKMSEGK